MIEDSSPFYQRTDVICIRQSFAGHLGVSRRELQLRILALPDYARAVEQHQAYCEALERCGLALIKLEPDNFNPDSTFVEDTAVPVDGSAVLTRPGAPSRAGEVQASGKSLLRPFLTSTQFKNRARSMAATSAKPEITSSSESLSGLTNPGHSS